MRYAIKQWLVQCTIWLATAALVTSCDMMSDDRDGCPTGLYLSFRYDYNLQRDDMFNSHVGAVSVYVFDDEGHFVMRQDESNTAAWAPLTSPLYTMHMNLAPGHYKFLVLAGQKSYDEQLSGTGARFVRTEPQAGQDMEGALQVNLEHGEPGADGYCPVVNNNLPLDTLWHGMELTPVEVHPERPTYHTLSLVRDTKKINVTLRDIDHPQDTRVENYDFRILDHNARLLWNNDVDESIALQYTPHATWNTSDRTPVFDAGGDAVDQVGYIAHADFMTSRIIYHEDPALDGVLSIRSKETGIECVRVNLPDILSRLRRYEDLHRYSAQEFLDRGYDYQLDFYLKDGRLNYVNIGISVLNWSMRVQYTDLK